MTDRILIGVDESEQALDALSFAADEWPESDLVLVSVIDPSTGGYTPGAGIPSGAEQWYERRKSETEELLASAADSLDTAGSVETTTTVGTPAAAIVDAADHDVDHIVVGSHGRGGISRIVLGSVAEAVVRNAPVPVTVVR